MKKFIQSRSEKLKKLSIPVLSFILLWACQHIAKNHNVTYQKNFRNCGVRPISLDVADSSPVFEEKNLPKGILIFEDASLYVEKYDENGDTLDKLHVTEKYDSAKKENSVIEVHCFNRDNRNSDK